FPVPWFEPPPEPPPPGPPASPPPGFRTLLTVSFTCCTAPFAACVPWSTAFCPSFATWLAGVLGRTLGSVGGHTCPSAQSAWAAALMLMLHPIATARVSNPGSPRRRIRFPSLRVILVSPVSWTGVHRVGPAPFPSGEYRTGPPTGTSPIRAFRGRVRLDAKPSLRPNPPGV